MFDTFKKAISTGSRIRLHLTNSNDKPEGTVIEIGENFVLLENPNKEKSHFFDKLIGGWDLIKAPVISSSFETSNVNENSSKTQIKFVSKTPNKIILKPKNTVYDPYEKEISLFQTNFPLTLKKKPDNLPNEIDFLFSSVEKNIKYLIQQGSYKEAMSVINKSLSVPKIPEIDKKNLILMKAQLFSSMREPENSEEQYKKLIVFIEDSFELRKNTNQLSHLCTELARIQSQKKENLVSALEAVKKAIHYNDKNIFAKNLLRQLERRATHAGSGEESYYHGEKITEEGDLQIETGDISSDISKMLQIDFQQHKYYHPTIIKNDGVPNPQIADFLLNYSEKEISKEDIAQRRLVYLEAAKAYSELNVGSYETENYLKAAAYYALLKGDVLYNEFKKDAMENKNVYDELIRIKDSACSYYMESAKLLSSISPESLLKIIENYLKMNIVLHFKKNGGKITDKDFSGSFLNVVKSCLNNRNNELYKIVWITFVDLGAASPHAWNALYNLPGGTGRLFAKIFTSDNKEHVYNLINSIWGWKPINSLLKPKDFFRKAFNELQKLENEFEKAINNILAITFEGNRIEQIIQAWSNIFKYENLLTTTDKETESSIDNVLEIAKPYSIRTPVERTNILITIQNMIDKQINFINRNTTIYGRTYFFPLLTKWKKDIVSLLKERVGGAGPELKVQVDPPYYIENNEEITIPLIIKNTGEATSEGCILNGMIEGEDLKHEFEFELKEEISAGSETSFNLNAPRKLIEKSDLVKFKVSASAKYMNNIKRADNFEFTLEKENESTLVREDVIWDETRIPKESLFKGRENIINMLYKHYLSYDRVKPYILYGLTRTGKSSILKYLDEKIDNTNIIVKGKEKKLITITWKLQEAAKDNASQFWEYIAGIQTFNKISSFVNINDSSFSKFRMIKWRANDFSDLIDCINNLGFYPLFLVDEFSFIKDLINKERGIIKPAFLASLREYSINDQASFLFAGTYDIKELIENKEYGITGQLVHAISEQIDKIENVPAEALIKVVDKLKFTDEAIAHIKKLSGNIPYFIQVICKYSGIYAVEKKRMSIGYPELEKVIRIITGLDIADNKSSIIMMPENIFQNNQYGTSDPQKVHALISSLAWFNRDRITNPRGVGFYELQELWSKYKVNAVAKKLADAIKILEDKKIISSYQDEGNTIYKISVDLFRRWWSVRHPNIELELSLIPEE